MREIDYIMLSLLFGIAIILQHPNVKCENGVRFFVRNKDTYPTIFRTAITILSFMVCNASCERSFGVMRSVFKSERSTLSNERGAYETQLAINMEILHGMSMMRIISSQILSWHPTQP